MEKLNHYGIQGTTHSWVKAFLTNRTQQVVLDGAKSGIAHVLSGVPQGTVLGPTLFLIFINDLPCRVKSSVRLFADDCVLFRLVRSECDHQILQEDLEALNLWENDWLMEFNADKCFVLNISKKRQPKLNEYYLKNTLLQTVDSTTYLGVEISKDLKWSRHIDKTVKKANKSLGFIRRNIKTNNTNTKTLAYQTLVRPILEYACQVWDPHLACEISKLESVQRRAARYVTNRFHNTSSVTNMLHELKWDSLQQRRCKSRLTMLYKMSNDLIDISHSDYLIPSTLSHHATGTHFIRPYSMTNYQKFSFFPRTIGQWNFLPPSIKLSNNLENFKAGVAELTIPELQKY